MPLKRYFASVCVTLLEFKMDEFLTKARDRQYTSLEDRLSDAAYEEDRYIKAIASRLNDEILNEFQKEKREILNVSEQTSQKLKQNVYKNYTRSVRFAFLIFYTVL